MTLRTLELRKFQLWISLSEWPQSILSLSFVMRLRSPQTLHYQKRTLLRASIELYKCLRLFFVSDPTQQVTSLPEPQWEYSHQRQVRFPLARVEGLALSIQSMQRLP